MPDFRYAQFCPLTRGVEILGERWTLLIVRELFGGPRRFSDLKSALNGVSPSVLTDRLAKLEERGILWRRELPPPSSSAIYELDEAGRALRPLLRELTRWGLRFLGTPSPNDRIRPEWLLLGFEVFARSEPTEEVGARLEVRDERESVTIFIRGGRQGTQVSASALPCDVVVRGTPVEMLLFVHGAIEADAMTFEGAESLVRRIPSLFDFQPTPAEPPAARPADLSTVSPADSPAAGRPMRGKPEPVAQGDRARGAEQ